MWRENYVLPLIILTIICVGWIANGQATILTTTGKEYSGSISGILSLVRLDIVPAVGPVHVFDIPRASILQMTIDFPRIIVETKDKVYIGPFSDFSGLKEIITLEKEGKTITIPLAGLRAVALNGNTLHPVPREWLGDRFLSGPTVLVTAVSALPEKAPAPSAQQEEHPINWAQINPTPVIPAEKGGTPWWVGLLVVVGIAGLVYLSLP